MNHALDYIDTFKGLFQKNEDATMASIGAFMLVAIIGMSAVTLTVLNTKATKGYQLNALETQRQELVTDLEINETLILRAQSMNSIESNTSYMVKPTSEDVYYVVAGSAVALNN
ncbi:MAG: hypothetical protein ACI9QC_000357 [Oceanicoccus sp.]|jgi:hypothetical protein